jgi:hypothetical protein
MSQYARTYNSFSGIDITPIFNGKSIGECQGISYSVSREKAPLYTLGSPNPRSFSRGKRGIAGAVVFLVFDRSALFDSLKDESLFWGNTWEQPGSESQKAELEKFAGLQSAQDIVDATDTTKIIMPEKTVQKAYYHDQIPPFDVKLVASTERGHGAIMEILGMEILNCGSGISVDDITTDESCTWIGVNIVPWHSQTYIKPGTVEGGTTYKEGTAYKFEENTVTPTT